MAVFWAEMDDSSTQAGRPWPEVQPGKSEGVPKIAIIRPNWVLRTPWSLATHPFGGPPAYGPGSKQDQVPSKTRP